MIIWWFYSSSVLYNYCSWLTHFNKIIYNLLHKISLVVLLIFNIKLKRYKYIFNFPLHRYHRQLFSLADISFPLFFCSPPLSLFHFFSLPFVSPPPLLLLLEYWLLVLKIGLPIRYKPVLVWLILCYLLLFAGEDLIDWSSIILFFFNFIAIIFISLVYWAC